MIGMHRWDTAEGDRVTGGPGDPSPIPNANLTSVRVQVVRVEARMRAGVEQGNKEGQCKALSWWSMLSSSRTFCGAFWNAPQNCPKGVKERSIFLPSSSPLGSKVAPQKLIPPKFGTLYVGREGSVLRQEMRCRDRGSEWDSIWLHLLEIRRVRTRRVCSGRNAQHGCQTNWAQPCLWRS